MTGALIAHIFHVLSVLMLYELASAVHPKVSLAERSRFAFLAAILHVVSPAGIFLSAPYAESSFSFLNFLGFYLYAKSLIVDHPHRFGIRRGIVMLCSGVALGIATTFRGNGLLSGLIFIHEAINCIIRILRSRQISCDSKALVALCASGILMALIAFYPQYLAYSVFCGASNIDEGVRPWCLNWVPSIYAWVQKEYW